MALSDYVYQRGEIKIPTVIEGSTCERKPSSGRERSNEDQRRKRAVLKIERWWCGIINKRVFKVLKYSICAAEHSLTEEIMRKLNPREAELLKDPALKAKIKFRLGGSSFPPIVLFKVFLSSKALRVQYFSGKTMIRPASEAAEDSRQQMGNRQFYDQMLADVCHHEQEQVTDEMDVTNMQEYMKFSAGLDESPAYMGGRENYWRKLTLDVIPRQCQMYSVVQLLFEPCPNSSQTRLMRGLHSISRPLTQKEQVECLKAISSLSVVNYLDTSKRSPLTASSSNGRRFPLETRERGSHLAQQRVRKMQKMYTICSSQETKEDPCTFSVTQDVEHGIDLMKDMDGKLGFTKTEEETEEQDALELYQWSQELSYDDLS